MIFHLVLVSITLPSPEFTGNIALTYKMSQLDVLQSFLRLILTMPNTSSPLERLRMPPRSLKYSSKLLTSHSSQTTRNHLKRTGLKAVIKVKRPLLTKRHRKERLDFALAHQNWTVEDWKTVVWSNETKINRLGSDGRVWGWKKAREGLYDRLVKETAKFGGRSLMMWGCCVDTLINCRTS